ncbi:hypothetical protein [Enterobacter hormaechei]|uniref:hypothetical protein n=1 Tax=Enterobacter hormaechei TaxID=158836 RepID=UPI001378F697|nr:hypothetical protein [Enterobacter hormaechei]NBF24559.1 hypothetical protein [Enterobacter hormaechei]
MLSLEVGAFHIGIEKAEITGDRTVGTIVEVVEGGQRHVRATFDGEVASVIELLANKARAAEQRVKELEAKQQRISLKPHVYRELVNQLRDTAVKYAGCQQLREQLSRTLQYALVADNTAPVPDVSAVARAALQYIDALPSEVVATLPAMPGFDRDWADEVLALATSPDPKPLTLANETMDVERLREIAEEDNGSDVKFEYSVMARMLLSVAINSDPVAYTDTEELESLEGVDGHSYAHLWPNSYGFGKDIALYTVPQMILPPVNILDDGTNRDVFEAWVADYTGHTKGFVRQFRVGDKYRSDSMWNKYWNTWNACRDIFRKANLLDFPDCWISRLEEMPDPASERRVCAFTPTEHEDLRYRFVPASLFKTVCSDATHWFYMLPPVGQEEVVGG